MLEDLQEQVVVRDRRHISSPRLEIGAMSLAPETVPDATCDVPTSPGCFVLRHTNRVRALVKVAEPWRRHKLESKSEAGRRDERMPLQCCRSPPRDSRDKGNERSAEDIEGLDSLPVLSARVPHRHGGMEPSNLVCVLSPLSMFEGSHSSRARPSAGVATQKIRRVYMFMFKVPIPHFLCGSAHVHLVTKPVRRCYLSSLVAGARQKLFKLA